MISILWCNATSIRVLHRVGSPASADGSRSGGESEPSSSDEEELSAQDLDAALEGVAVSRSSSVSKSQHIRGGLGDSFAAASKQLRDDSSSAVPPLVSPARGVLQDNRKFQFHGPSQIMPASLPIIGGMMGRQLRPISELRASTTTMSGFTTESKMVQNSQNSIINIPKTKPTDPVP